MSDQQKLELLERIFKLLKDHYSDGTLEFDRTTPAILVKKFLYKPIRIAILVEGKYDLWVEAEYTEAPQSSDLRAFQEWLFSVLGRRGFYPKILGGKIYIYAGEPVLLSTTNHNDATQIIRVIGKVESKFVDLKDDLECALSLNLRFNPSDGNS